MKHFGLRTFLISAALVAVQAVSAQAGPSLCNGAPNGIIDGKEQCELGPCCTNKCELMAPSTVCRAGSGQCDPAETCGAQEPASFAGCPADVVIGDGEPCSDGLFCTVGETCNGGVCGGGVPGGCDDGNPCTVDNCKEQNDTCSYSNLANGTPCDDGNACTTNDTCSGGQCVGGTAVTCNDGNACTDDVCNPTTGQCEAINNSAPCDDGLFCTVGDVCSGGQCTGGTGTPCTAGGACQAGICDEALDSCSYQQADDGAPCEDGLFCTIGETCTAGVCGGGVPNTCDDGNDCTSDSCNEGSNRCQYTNTNQNGPCDDGLFCTVGETCKSGQCLGTARDCGDANVCTDDSCNEDADQCDNLPNTAPCDDGLFCTSNDTCSGGTCSNTTPTCSDGNVCTDDVCDEAADSCSYPNNTAPCEDGLFCTVNDTCGGGSCQAGQARDCGDGNLCTDDSCDEGADSCVNANNTAPCDDGLFCTVGDTCGGGVCAGTARDCGDGNVCTDDSCDEGADSCVNANNTAPCDDGLFCTVGDTCGGGSCQAGAARDCGDGNVCTNDSCDEDANACLNANNTDPCDDGLFCTVGDTCSEGACTGTARDCGDGNACTTDSCDEGADSCVNANNTIPCDDGLFCTVDDACSGGVCTGAARNCSDGNVCTDDVCDEDSDSCENPNNTAPCEDGLACTGGDTCADGECVGGSADGCDDGNACTDDSCDAEANACVNVPNEETACDDGDACTTGDSCEEGVCVGEAVDCDDENECTDDSCDSASGECVNANNTIPCNDGLFCTVDDACDDGLCTGAARNCDDGNVCTDDACNEASDECDNLDNTAACDDGVFCNGPDSCQGGECVVHAGDPCDGPGDNDGDCSETCDEEAGDCSGQDEDGSACSDLNSCTIGDQCLAGECVPGEVEDEECVPTTTTTSTSTTTTTTTLETTTTTMDTTTTTTLPEGPRCGDFNGDGDITAPDALGVLRASVGLVECPLSICDYSGDGRTSALDALAVLREAVGLPSNPNCPAEAI